MKHIKTMKTRSIILAAAFTLLIAGCGPKVSDKTVVTGNLGADAPEMVTITIKPLNFNRNFTVQNGQFKAEVPKYVEGLTKLKAGNITGSFISDGTPLTISFNEDKSLKVTSKYPKISVQARYDAFNKSMQDIQAIYQPQIEAAKDEATEDKLYDAFQSDVKKLCLATVDANKDNLTAVSAIENLRYLLTNDQMDSVLTTIDTGFLPSRQSPNQSLRGRRRLRDRCSQTSP